MVKLGMKNKADSDKLQEGKSATRIMELRSKVDKFWLSGKGERPYLEIAFASGIDLNLSVGAIKSVIPGACVDTENGFPFYFVPNHKVHTSKSWGWMGIVPYSDEPNPNKIPSHLWMLTRGGVFVYRKNLWEDKEGSVIPNGVGIYHITSNLILLIRFIQNFARILKLSELQNFQLEFICNNIRGRYIENEKNVSILEHNIINKDRVYAKIIVNLDKIYKDGEFIIANLIEEIVWQFGRTDWDQFITYAIKNTHYYYGPEVRII